MPNPWIQHIKDWARRHNMSYGCALSNPECRRAYKNPAAEREQMASEDINQNYFTITPKKRKPKRQKDDNYLISNLKKYKQKILTNNIYDKEFTELEVLINTIENDLKVNYTEGEYLNEFSPKDVIRIIDNLINDIKKKSKGSAPAMNLGEQLTQQINKMKTNPSYYSYKKKPKPEPPKSLMNELKMKAIESSSKRNKDRLLVDYIKKIEQDKQKIIDERNRLAELLKPIALQEKSRKKELQNMSKEDFRLIDDINQINEMKQMALQDYPAPADKKLLSPQDYSIIASPAKPKRGRPKKYASAAEAKKAKTEMTVASNKRRRAEKKYYTEEFEIVPKKANQISDVAELSALEKYILEEERKNKKKK